MLRIILSYFHYLIICVYMIIIKEKLRILVERNCLWSLCFLNSVLIRSKHYSFNRNIIKCLNQRAWGWTGKFKEFCFQQRKLLLVRLLSFVFLFQILSELYGRSCNAMCLFSFLAHLSPRLMWAFLITIRPSSWMSLL